MHIYRFISETTIEEQLLRKANQKRALDDIVIQKGGFDWRKCEDAINEIPQFTRDIELEEGFGMLNVHYVHQRSEVESAVPLLFVHGCECILVGLVRTWC